MRFDGLLPCVSQNSQLWSVQDGKELTAYQICECMGHKMSTARYHGTPLSEPKLRKMIGLGMHVAACGAMMMAMLASTSSGSRSA